MEKIIKNALLQFLQNIKAEIEADGGIATIEEAIERITERNK